MPGKRRPVLEVVFDSSTVYTKSASHLLCEKVSNFIKKHSRHSDLRIVWCLPEVVVNERKYQMQEAGKKLLPSTEDLEKLEELLDRKLDIRRTAIDESVSHKTGKQIEDHKIRVLTLDVTKVDWGRLIDDAVFRRPPFESGEKEKGFRDALIAETFLQLVSSSRASWVAFVTKDGLLTRSVTLRTQKCASVRVIESVEELKGFLNTLGAGIEEGFVAELQGKAASLFFREGDETTLYYKKDVLSRIMRAFETEFKSFPLDADRRDNGHIHIAAPIFNGFDEMKARRMVWVSRISVGAKAYRQIHPPLPPLPYTNYVGHLEDMRVLPSRLPAGEIVSADKVDNRPTTEDQPSRARTYEPFAILSLESSFGKPQPDYAMTYSSDWLVDEGESEFDVAWSVTVDIHKRLSRPKIESIDFVGTTWRQPKPSIEGIPRIIWSSAPR
jgi:hypothetical protein